MSRLVAGVAVVGALLALPLPAAADPAGPTSYETTITDVEPPTDAISVRMLGGDAFVELTAAPGTDVVVMGYRGEPYLRFAPDGTVSRNLRSESTYLNEDRYADAEVPPEADNDAEPLWEEVGVGGRYAWHDHRTHWMNTEPPPSAEPGDTILEATVPLTVDGEAVVVAVRSTYVAPPGPWAASLGAVVGLVAAAAAVRIGPGGVRSTLIVVGVAAATVGIWERLSLPAEAAASALVFLLPGGAIAFAAIARPPVAAVATAASAAQLVAWAVLRWPVLTEPILPTNAPWALDRFVTAMVLTGAIGCLVAAVRSLVRPAPAT
jgi:hypothetical protein